MRIVSPRALYILLNLAVLLSTILSYGLLRAPYTKFGRSHDDTHCDLCLKSKSRKNGRLNLLKLFAEVNVEENIATIPSDYVFHPPEVGIEIYVGSFVAMIPIIWATIEFASRIRIQRACLVCHGSGLVYQTKKGTTLSRPRKCWNCGGFIPCLGWKKFFLSSFYDIGNGGPLRRPASNYEQVNKSIISQDDDLNNHVRIKSIENNNLEK